MAIYRRVYRPYDGPLTPEGARFRVLARSALSDLFESRVLTLLIVLCFVPFLIQTAIVYVSNSAAVRALLRLGGDAEPMVPAFFFWMQSIQGVLACVLTAWVAPVLVAPDLVNGALPLHLSRPLSRLDYVIGKAIVLAGFLSAITWVPGLLLFALQAGLAGHGWFASNVRIAVAIVVGGLIWVTVLTLLGLAVSATIRWRVVASAAVVGVLFMGGAFGNVWTVVLHNPWGQLANLPFLMGIVWRDLFFADATSAASAGAGRGDFPMWLALLGLAASAAASAWLLHARLRAREVVS